MIALTHPTGNANVRGALKAFSDASMLAGFYTTLGFTEEKLANLPDSLNRRLQRRSYDLPEALLHTRPFREVLRLSTQAKLQSVDSVYCDLDRHLAKQLMRGKLPRKTRAIYAYEDGADQCFSAAQNKGLKCIYEQPIGYWRAARRILTEEAEREPAWASTIGAIRDSDEKCDRKDRELSKADVIITASSFTHGSLQEYPGRLAPVSVISYGTESLTQRPEHKPAAKCRALFVGGLSQRKGLSYLFKALEGMESLVELTIVGRAPSKACPALSKHLQQHRWIESMPHSEILTTMRESDVLIFPSLFEGFGLVITEALSQGIPVIATPHTIAPDIIEDGKEGFIVPIRDAQSIQQRLEVLAKDTERLSAMKEAAWQRSRTLTWARYASDLVATAQATLSRP